MPLRAGDASAYTGLRETSFLPSLVDRAADALAWLGARAEREIVVVSHQVPPRLRRPARLTPRGPARRTGPPPTPRVRADQAFTHHLFSFGHTRKLKQAPPVVEYAKDEMAVWMTTPLANCECRTLLATWPS